MPNGKINFVGNASQTMVLVDMPNTILQVNGTKTIDLNNITLTRSSIAKTVVGWGANDSALTSYNSSYANGDITFSNSGSNNFDLGDIVEGDDPNSKATGTDSKDIILSDSKVDFDSSELMTKLANLVTNLVVQLCWEWTAADTGTISFEDTINLTDAAWSDTQTGAATRADRIR